MNLNATELREVFERIAAGQDSCCATNVREIRVINDHVRRIEFLSTDTINERRQLDNLDSDLEEAREENNRLRSELRMLEEELRLSDAALKEMRTNLAHALGKKEVTS